MNGRDRVTIGVGDPANYGPSSVPHTDVSGVEGRKGSYPRRPDNMDYSRSESLA